MTSSTLLALLVDKSMVQRDRGSDERFTLLETLRQFAEERLDAGRRGSPRWRERHAALLRAAGRDNDRRFFGPDEPDAVGQLRRRVGQHPRAVDVASVGGDLRRAAELVTGAHLYGLYAMRYELGDWATAVLAFAEQAGADLSAEDAWRLRGIRAWAAWSSGDYEFAVDECERAIAAGALEPTWWFKNFVGYVRRGDAEQMDAYATALRDAKAPDPRGEFFTAIPQPFNLVGTAAASDDGVGWAQRALDIATAAGFRTGIANASHRGVALRHADPEGACEEFRQTIEVASAIDPDHMLIDAALDGLAQASAFTGELERRTPLVSGCDRVGGALPLLQQPGRRAPVRRGRLGSRRGCARRRPASGLRAGIRPSRPRQRRSGGDRRSQRISRRSARVAPRRLPRCSTLPRSRSAPSMLCCRPTDRASPTRRYADGTFELWVGPTTSWWAIGVASSSRPRSAIGQACGKARRSCSWRALQGLVLLTREQLRDRVRQELEELDLVSELLAERRRSAALEDDG